MQGRASLSSLEDPDAWLEAMGDNWERFGGKPRDVGPLWEWWLRVYHWRVNIEIAVERLVVWPDLACRGAPEVHGAPLPAEPPPPQRRPARGTRPADRPRARGAGGRRACPTCCSGWVGADGFPVVVPVEVAGTRGARHRPRGRRRDSFPPGGRRAGLLAHWFSRHVVGQRQRKHTGWLEAEHAAGRVALCAAHRGRLQAAAVAIGVQRRGRLRHPPGSARRATGGVPAPGRT